MLAKKQMSEADIKLQLITPDITVKRTPSRLTMETKIPDAERIIQTGGGE